MVSYGESASGGCVVAVATAEDIWEPLGAITGRKGILLYGETYTKELENEVDNLHKYYGDYIGAERNCMEQQGLLRCLYHLCISNLGQYLWTADRGVSIFGGGMASPGGDIAGGCGHTVGDSLLSPVDFPALCGSFSVFCAELLSLLCLGGVDCLCCDDLKLYDSVPCLHFFSEILWPGYRGLCADRSDRGI